MKDNMSGTLVVQVTNAKPAALAQSLPEMMKSHQGPVIKIAPDTLEVWRGSRKGRGWTVLENHELDPSVSLIEEYFGGGGDQAKARN